MNSIDLNQCSENIFEPSFIAGIYRQQIQLLHGQTMKEMNQ